MTDSRTTELLPCPFCGGDDIGLSGTLPYFRNKNEYGWTVMCADCGGSVGFILHEPFMLCAEFATMGDAVSAWNARAELGNGTLTAEQVMTIAGKHQPDYCSDTHVCFDWQAIADELNALAERTCKRVWLEDWLWRCSECGSQHDTAHLYNYCPNCGARIEVDE